MRPKRGKGHEVLQRWDKPLPRLCYVTDAGDNETTYFTKVLRPMRHPRTGERLDWIRVLDYYHASEYIGKMAEAGESIENILEDYPNLTEGDVKFARLYFKARPSVGRPRSDGALDGRHLNE